MEETTEDAAQVLLLSLEHAASGTNLTAANHELQRQIIILSEVGKCHENVITCHIHVILFQPFREVLFILANVGCKVVFVHPMHASSAERAVAYEAQAIARCRRYGQEKTEPKLQWERKWK